MSTDDEWEAWGRRDPYFAVLTNPKFRTDSLTPEAKAEFFASGEWTADYVLRSCRQYFDGNFNPGRVLDFGCGLGRVSIPYARRAKEVVGLDIADSMLTQARINAQQVDCTNVIFAKSDDDLSNAAGHFDLVSSCIVLQHVEMNRGLKLFAALVEKVAAGGCGAIQLPFGWEMHPQEYGLWPAASPPPPEPKKGLFATIRDKLSVPAPPASQISIRPVDADPEMQMNSYNFSQIFFILQMAGITGARLDFTNHGGALGAFMFFRRDPA